MYLFLVFDKLFILYLINTVCMCACSVKSNSLQPHAQASILEGVAIPFCRGSSQPRDQTYVSCIEDRFFTTKSPREHQK